MASTDGPATDPLIRELAAAPHAFDFFVAMRRLQALFAAHPRIGHATSPAHEAVRFAQSPELTFAPATLAAFTVREDGLPPVLYSRHFGVFGPNGPLPLCLTEYAYTRIRHHNDRTFAAFANLFHHRLLSFFFRAGAAVRKDVDYDRPEESAWGQHVGSLIGLGLESFRGRDSVPDDAKLYYAGRLLQQTRNADGLEAIIQDFFGIKTEVQTFRGHWMDLPPGSECRLGATPSTGRLGETAIVGSRIWHCQMSFRVRMGPMGVADFHRMLPDKKSFQRLRDWVRLYVGDHLIWDMQLVLAKAEVPAAQLGRNAHLGWLTWLKTRPFDHDAEELIIPGNN